MSDKESKNIKEAGSIVRRWIEIRQIIIKRKSAFTVYEWMKIKEFINIIE